MAVANARDPSEPADRPAGNSKGLMLHKGLPGDRSPREPGPQSAPEHASLQASALACLRHHWPEYFIEGALLGAFMLSAALFTALLEYPGSPAHQIVQTGTARRGLVGLAMGLTAIALVYSPWGQRSGAHLNPAVTLTFLRQGRMSPWDALGYVTAQFVGGTGGMLFARSLLGEILAHPAVGYVTTVPGPAGAAAAFAVELMMAGGMMLMVQFATNTPRIARFTGIFAGGLVAGYITVAAPISGMSINPARTVASAVPSGVWTYVWIYFAAPILGMMLAAKWFDHSRGSTDPGCPKLHHGTTQRCIFCGYQPKGRDSASIASCRKTNPL